VSHLGDRARSRVAGLLSTISRPFGRFGSEGGCLQVDLWDCERRVSVTAVSGDQRLAILPCAMAVQALLEEELPERGVIHPAEWLSPETWIGELRKRGARILTAHR
jgi:hypothetical protein